YTGRGSLPCAWSSRARRGTVCMGLLDSGDRGRGAPVCDAREELAQRRPVRRAVPLVLEIFGDVVLGNKLAACEKSHHRMEIAGVVRMLRIVLRDPADRDIERVDAIMVWPILERDREVALGRAELAVMYVVERQLFVIPGRAVR